MNSFRYLDHIADVGIEVIAETLNDLYCTAAQALTKLFMDDSSVDQGETRTITLHAQDNESLLFQWLNEILFLFDSEGFILKEVYQIEIAMTAENMFKLEASLAGERFNPERHQVRTYVKAATYHHLSITSELSSFRARIFLDV